MIYSDGVIFSDFEYPNGETTISTSRNIPDSNLPCIIAGLIGVVGADSNVYYCCQHRGESDFKVGSLKKESFINLWQKRLDMKINISKCPHCRYMNYSKAYRRIEKGDLFFQHRYFL